MSEPAYTTNPGDLVAIWITGVIGTFIAEVIENDPYLVLKVTESGPYAKLKWDDYILREEDTVIVQQNERDDDCEFLKAEQAAGRHVYSGLERLGAGGDQPIELLPGE